MDLHTKLDASEVTHFNELDCRLAWTMGMDSEAWIVVFIESGPKYEV